jgi:hypothetical protein
MLVLSTYGQLKDKEVARAKFSGCKFVIREWKTT